MNTPSMHEILHARGKTYHWEGRGLLSIKMFFHGQSFYSVGCGQYLVDESSYLILNHDQYYTITIDSPTPVESFCVFFAPGFAETVQHSLLASQDRLLDDPYPTIPPLNFFERTYPRDDILSPVMLRLYATKTGGYHEVGWQEEQLHAVMQQLLHVHQCTSNEVAALPALRASTREELYRRVCLARDYAAACFDQPLQLDDLARVACLSANHLLRTFKTVFQQTPHQFLTTKRLERACQLLRQTEMSVTDICFAVGFSSPGSFSWLFRQRIGSSPQAYRYLHR